MGIICLETGGASGGYTACPLKPEKVFPVPKINSIEAFELKLLPANQKEIILACAESDGVCFH